MLTVAQTCGFRNSRLTGVTPGKVFADIPAISGVESGQRLRLLPRATSFARSEIHTRACALAFTSMRAPNLKYSTE